MSTHNGLGTVMGSGPGHKKAGQELLPHMRLGSSKYFLTLLPSKLPVFFVLTSERVVNCFNLGLQQWNY